MWESVPTFWSVREYMFPMICAAILRVSVDRSWNALWTMGIIKARDGASMKCTNLVSSSVCRQWCVLWDGSVKASSRMGVIAVEFTISVQCQHNRTDTLKPHYVKPPCYTSHPNKKKKKSAGSLSHIRKHSTLTDNDLSTSVSSFFKHLYFIPRISGLRITEPICRSACWPAFCTFTWESVRTSVSLGTMFGRHEDNCLGAQYAIAPNNSTDPTHRVMCYK